MKTLVALIVMMTATAYADDGATELAARVKEHPESLDAPRLLVQLVTEYEVPHDEAVAMARDILAHAPPRGRAEAIRALALAGAVGEAQAALAAWQRELGTERPAMHLLAIELAVAASPKDPHVAESNEAQHYCVHPPLDAELWCWRARSSATPGLDRLRLDANDHQEDNGDLRMFDDRDDDRRDLGDRIARALRTAEERCPGTYGMHAPIGVSVNFEPSAPTFEYAWARGADHRGATCVQHVFRADADLLARVHRATLRGHFQITLREAPEPQWRRHELLAFVTGVIVGGDDLVQGGGADVAIDVVHLTDELGLGVRANGLFAAGAHDRYVAEGRAFLGASVVYPSSLAVEAWFGYERTARSGARAWHLPIELDVRYGDEHRTSVWARSDDTFGAGVTWRPLGTKLFTAVEFADRDGASQLSVLVGLPVFDNRVW